MSYPVEIDAVVIKLGDGATPEVFTTVCGMENVTLNQTVQTNDRFRRDCAKPGQVPSRKVRVTGKQWDITANGVANIAEIDRLKGALGISHNYQIVAIEYDGTDGGNVLGTFSGPAVMTANNMNLQPNEGTTEITLAGENELEWVAA